MTMFESNSMQFFSYGKTREIKKKKKKLEHFGFFKHLVSKYIYYLFTHLCIHQYNLTRTYIQDYRVR